MKLINEDEFIKNIVKYKYFSTKTIGEALGNTKEFKGFDYAIRDIEELKDSINEVIKTQNRKELIEFINGINACLCIIYKYRKEKPHEND